MRELQEIIQLAQKVLSCPICHRNYQLGEIKLQGFFEDIYILRVNCQNHHHPLVMTVIISRQPLERESIKDIFQHTNTQPSLDSIKPEEVVQLADFLATFDGDFQKLWKR